ncbi:protein Loquacious-like isoform X1 [Haemaphysalis longicornis]
MESSAAASVNQKTPISILQELCARNCLTPEYKLLSVEGAVHAPTFMYRVQVGDVVANATGQSKKKSKHAAARVILEKLLADDGPFAKYRAAVMEDLPSMDATDVVATAVGEMAPSNNGLPGSSPLVGGAPLAGGGSTGTGSSAGTEEDGIAGNPVGELQELCMKLRWRPPFYETVIEDGLPHERTFGISCLVNNLNEMGKGKSKRLAKRQAAKKMIELIKTVQNGLLNGEDEKFGEPGVGVPGGGGGGGPCSTVLREAKSYMGLKEQNISALTPRHSQQVGQLLRQLQASDGVRLAGLQGTSLSTAGLDYVGLLREIADEQSFEVTYVPIEELSPDGKHQCLVQLTSLPLAVCFGTADTAEQAQVAAARSALQYLKIMTKK